MTSLRAIVGWLGIALLITWPMSAADSGATWPLPRRPVVERIEPISFEAPQLLYDPSRPGTLEMTIVFSQPQPRPSGGGGGIGGFLSEGSREADISKAIRGAEARLRERGLEFYRETTGDEQGMPHVNVAYNDSRRGQDHASDLESLGFSAIAREDLGGGEWAGLWGKLTPAKDALLGEVTRKITITFSPEVRPSGAVGLGAIATAVVGTERAPRGVSAELWARETRRIRRLTGLQAGWLSARLNLQPLHLPSEAAAAFAAGNPYTLMRRVPLWGRERETPVKLFGRAVPIAEGSLGKDLTRLDPVVPSGDWRKKIVGSWKAQGTEERCRDWEGYLHIAEADTGGGSYFSMDTHAWTTAVDPSLQADRILLRMRSGRLGVAALQISPTADAAFYKGSTLDGSGRVTGSFLLQRLKPVIQGVAVRPHGGLADWKSYDEVRSLWEKGDAAWVDVLFVGAEFPREITGMPVGILDLGSAPTPARVQLGDERLELFSGSESGNSTDAQGTRLPLTFILHPGLPPGPKRILIDGVPYEFDPFHPDGQEPAPEITALQIQDPYDSMDLDTRPGMFGLVAAYSAAPPESQKSARVWIEREGAEIFRIRDGLTMLEQSGLNYSTSYSASFPLEGSSVAGVTSDAGNATGGSTVFRPQQGDVICAELDGKTTRLGIRAVVDPRAIPTIRFSADPDGLKLLGEPHTLNGRWAQMLPVGQVFWIDARYGLEQNVPVKKVAFSWSGGQLEVELKLTRPAIHMYLGGPFYVAPALPAVGSD